MPKHCASLRIAETYRKLARQSTLLALCAFLPTGVAMAAEITGTAKVTDGDTIRIGDTRIRLWGIDAPERRQSCQGRNGDAYECGRDSAAALNDLTRGRRVESTEKDQDRYGRVVAVCRTEAGELNAAMVRGDELSITRSTATGAIGRSKPQRNAKV